VRTSYQYRLKPTNEQAEKIDNTLDMLRCQYNYQLAQRFDWYEQNRCSVDRCSLVVCHIPELKDKPNRFSQQATLTQLKKDRPWYKDIHSQVLQEVPKKVEIAFDRWLKGDSNGKRSGKPRFKGKGQYKTFTYPQFKKEYFSNDKITLSKIGTVKVIVHRQIPPGFDIKTVSVTQKANGYYVTLSLDDRTVPTVKPDFNANNSNKVKKPLSQRIHNCPSCQVSLCRDLNAAINIKNRGTHDLKAQIMSSLKSL
jgi:putative transposase